MYRLCRAWGCYHYILMGGIAMQNKFARTDLAAEAAARSDQAPVGLHCEDLSVHGCTVRRVAVSSEAAARAVGKPRGCYLTLELADYVTRRAPCFSDCASALSELLRSFAAVRRSRSFLVACLGNRAVTPDAIGPCAADSIIVTRHLKSSLPEGFAAFSSVSVLRTGVLGTTGIESAQQIRSFCELVRPDCVIAVDALATGELGRICRNIQLCDSGISPGSGVGNDRAEINEGFLGCPVIAVGVPTVCDAAALGSAEGTEGLFVTPRNIDELVRSLSKLIAYGIDLALHDGLALADIETLIE